MVEFLDEVIDERHATVCGNNKPKQQAIKSSFLSFIFRNYKDIEDVVWKRLIWNSTEHCIRKYTEIPAKIYYVVGQFGPNLAVILIWMLKPLPRPMAVKIYSRIQYEFRYFIKRKTSFTKGSPFLATLRMLLYSRHRRPMMDIFGHDLVAKHLFRVLGVALAVQRVSDMMATVTQADGFKIAMAYDPAVGALVFRAYDSDFPLDLGTLQAIGFGDLAREVEHGNITLKKVIWSPVGMGGISKSPPFMGSFEFNNLRWGLEKYPVKVVRFLESKLSNFLLDDALGRPQKQGVN